MARLEAVSVEDLEAALADAEDPKAAKRLVVAIIYKRGPSVPMLAEWLDTREQTIYRWFDRLESEPVREAVRDRPKPGRPSKLPDDAREQFEAAVTGSPADVGFDDPAWTTELAREFLAREFDVEYSRRHVQRLLREAGLDPTPPPDEAELEPDHDRRRYWA